MAKKLFGLSVFLWILIALVVLYFVYGGVGRREGFYIVDKTTGEIKKCSDYSDLKSCNVQSVNDHLTCTWDAAQKKCMQPKS
jgi:hypothetical protein